MEFMYFLDNVRGAFWGDLGGSWPLPRPDFFGGALFAIDFKKEEGPNRKRATLGGRPGGVWGGWGGLGGLRGSQPGSQAARQPARQPGRQPASQLGSI